jgi:iron uptake system component EfeO
MRAVGILSTVIVLGLSGCADEDIAPTPIAVNSSDSACDVMPTQAPAGPVVFSVQNGASRTMDFALLGNGAEIVGKLENLEPGASRDLVVDIQQGTYVTSCSAADTQPMRAEFTADAP